MVDAVSKIAANERHRGEIMLEFPGQQHADRHFAPENCVLGCTKVTLTEDCSMSVFTPLLNARNDRFGSKADLTASLRHTMSALPPEADKEQTFRYVRFVPKADLRTAPKGDSYRTSKARGNSSCR